MAKKKGDLILRANTGKGIKLKKGGMFKALKKQKKRTGVIGLDRSDPHSSKRKAKMAKRSASASDVYRNFDERMKAKKARRSGLIPKASAVATTNFVMAAPTFQLNLTSVQSAPAPREVDGFPGFISALEAPKDAPVVNSNKQVCNTQRMQSEYCGSNVFAVLDNDDEDQSSAQKMKLPLTPAYIRPATFTFATEKFPFSPQTLVQSSLKSSLYQSMQSSTVIPEIDPDL
ncbi:uncharacterized protein PHALS_04466 [Plasmopara halstedii]|uniref:Uncharacterized protein n=1 Tax=Plasmopara halstedii TaxID=4781 RepID=A0A0P1A9U2_PLAHL|nr:uncharacterized protein PHALS_04466 [Plasmopara halstedii]CEG37000.1 hypothetical protein PHALS_04466 [Plasmopara halstedii]|eukprot:XP_024573369.1 hypothetical protein PHALS_04466 [Plasmopara halstedii]